MSDFLYLISYVLNPDKKTPPQRSILYKSTEYQACF